MKISERLIRFQKLKRARAKIELAVLASMPLLYDTYTSNILCSRVFYMDGVVRHIDEETRRVYRLLRVSNPGCLSPRCEAGYETCSVCRGRRASRRKPRAK